ncbi:hypothetical protein MKW98_009384, partial [Papaver atlanticum]
AGAAKQPSCGTILKGEAVTTVIGGLYMTRAVEMRVVIHQLDTSASVYTTNDLKVIKDHYLLTIEFRQLKTLPLKKGRNFKLLVSYRVVNPLTVGICLRLQLFHMQGCYLEVNMKIHVRSSTGSEGSMPEGASIFKNVRANPASYAYISTYKASNYEDGRFANLEILGTRYISSLVILKGGTTTRYDSNSSQKHTRCYRLVLKITRSHLLRYLRRSYSSYEFHKPSSSLVSHP